MGWVSFFFFFCGGLEGLFSYFRQARGVGFKSIPRSHSGKKFPAWRASLIHARGKSTMLHMVANDT